MSVHPIVTTFSKSSSEKNGYKRLAGIGDSLPAERFSCAKRDSFRPKGLHQLLLPFVVEVRLLADDRCGGTAVQQHQTGKQAGNAI
ncbi:MAG: hypothetical protein OEY45_05035 [Gammaproteobacteria bacterium]|nr:hypothetical protein [Gammaproteobacteria bacterium]MDH5514506.1 hypothetical protein [Gammaproteobacteria bacterium]